MPTYSVPKPTSPPSLVQSRPNIGFVIAPSLYRGVTLLEIIALVSVVGVVSGIAFTMSTGSPTVVTAARSLASHVVAERTHAIVRSQPSMCIQPRSGQATLRSWPSRGLMFTPDGLPRTCDGGGVANSTILLEHGGRQAAVIISSLGRVRWELR